MADAHIRPIGARPLLRRGNGQRVALVVVAGLAAMLATLPPTADSIPNQESPVAVTAEIPEVLRGDTWLRHHREDLMPYWDRPEALGEPLGNFPSFRGRHGELLPESPESTVRGLSTLARQVYGYSHAFMMTGEDRYLTYAKAGLDWINTKAKDQVYGGYYGRLTINGDPVEPTADKSVFDLASLGLAYGMYFNVTRDPAAEADLLAVRDLIFDKYYDAAENRVKDALTYDLATEVDTNDNGGDITNLLVPGTAVLLPNLATLTDPVRRAQFKSDLRRVTNSLIARHKNSSATNPAQRFWFWGRTLGFGDFDALQTDFGHNIKSYEMIYNANNLFADHPWQSLDADRDRLLQRAWDSPAARWNQRIRNFVAGNVVPDSEWWIHDEADQLLAAMDLHDGFAQPGPAGPQCPVVPRRVRRPRPALPGPRDLHADRPEPRRHRPSQVVLRQEHAPQQRARADHVPPRSRARGQARQALLRLPGRAGTHSRRQALLVRRGGGDTDSHPRRDHAPRAQGRRGRVHRDRRGGSLTLPSSSVSGYLFETRVFSLLQRPTWRRSRSSSPTASARPCVSVTCS